MLCRTWWRSLGSANKHSNSAPTTTLQLAKLAAAGRTRLPRLPTSTGEHRWRGQGRQLCSFGAKARCSLDCCCCTWLLVPLRAVLLAVLHHTVLLCACAIAEGHGYVLCMSASPECPPAPLFCCAVACRDVLRFADADEAEAVYSMVALTQARTPEWQAQPEQQQQRQPAGAAAAAAQVTWRAGCVYSAGAPAPTAAVTPAAQGCSHCENGACRLRCKLCVYADLQLGQCNSVWHPCVFQVQHGMLPLRWGYCALQTIMLAVLT